MKLLHPEAANRSCDDCEKYLYNDKPGRMGLVVVHGGRKCERVNLKLQPTPCRYCPKIPEDEPPKRSSAIELSERNAAAWFHYQRCKAVGRFPVDAIVERNAAYIAQIEDEAKAELARLNQLESLTVMLTSVRK